MKNILLILAIFICLPLSIRAQADKCFCKFDGDTITIGNNRIERSFEWNGGALKTISITDVLAGKTLTTDGQEPDFSLGESEAEGAVLDTLRCQSNGLIPSRFVIRISYRSGDAEVIREYTLFDDVPAISCETYLRGHVFLYADSEDNAADRKNIESFEDMARGGIDDIAIDQLSFSGRHWYGRSVLFRDVTDWHNNLVQENSFLSYKKMSYRGNILIVRNAVDNSGFFFIKEAPCSEVQLGDCAADFTAEFGHFQTVGLGIMTGDITPDKWTKVYGCVLGVPGETELSLLTAIRSWQKTIRRQEDMVMMNTWGDRSQDTKVNEGFCLDEVELAARLGVTVFQIDDGWQGGKSPNSRLAKGSFENIWSNTDYWTPDPQKYPNGLSPIVERGREIGIETGLWFNPSSQDEFADWEKDVSVLVRLYRDYGIRIFKIDGLVIPTKKAEENLRKMFDTVREATDDKVVFNLDVTAGRRGGYNYLGEYGNLFLENRYTDWGNYYPCHTLRNLWQLSRYVPAENFQIEFLNPWRNRDVYPEGDPYAPYNYSFEYLAAISFAGQPLAWMEASNLPEEAFFVGNVIRRYSEIAPEFHSGTILPIGDEPSGHSWTGFQSVVSDKEGFIIVFREDADRAGNVKTWLPEGKRVKMEPVLGSGARIRQRVGKDGEVRFKMKEKNSYTLYRYSL